jgi:hypothetical protein
VNKKQRKQVLKDTKKLLKEKQWLLRAIKKPKVDKSKIFNIIIGIISGVIILAGIYKGAFK